MPFSHSRTYASAGRARVTATIGSLVILLALGAAARADKDSDKFSWEPALKDSDEDRKAYEEAMKMGDDNAILAGRLTHERDDLPLDYRTRSRKLREAINRAIRGYEKAFDIVPDAAEPYYRAAEVLNAYYVERGINTPVIVNRYRPHARRAIAYWQQFERLAPLDPRVRNTLFNRAIVHTKMADEVNYKQAVELYEAIIRRSDMTATLHDDVATWYGNMAETYMMIGDLEPAIANYKIALEAFDRTSIGYGLAVALDRDEQGDLARDYIRRYGVGGLRSMIRDKTVFYVPEGERFYYIALGFDAMGHWDEAIKYYQAFIDSGAHPGYQARARENLSWAKKQRRAMRKRKLKPPKLPPRLGI